LAEASIALAELVYKNGFSAVLISSPFNSEFMEHASTAALPAYLPVDGHDLHVALTEIDHHLHQLYPNRLGNKALMGYSMGAFETMYIASTARTNYLLQFDRYVAINTPVRIAQGISKLDEFYRAPLDWPVAERSKDIDNTFLKVAALGQGTLTPQTSLPFSAIESKFLIGLYFRLELRDMIYSSQRRNNQGVLRHHTSHWRRNPVYQEILQYSFQDYFQKFVIPYYQHHGLPVNTAQTLQVAGDLRTYEAGLRANPDTRVIVNENDFLLTDDDLMWLSSTFGPGQLTVFKRGGHLGNLFNPTVQKSILAALTPMRPPAINPKPQKN
jgi:pimeloyl-ACP methyl ester carboxylesterase